MSVCVSRVQITYETLAYFSSAGTRSFLSRIYPSIYLSILFSTYYPVRLSPVVTFFKTSIQGTVNRMNHSLACLRALFQIGTGLFFRH